MDSYDPPFHWVRFPEGRARFSGTKRGWDELGHTTFAIELGGNELFGEIDQAFLPDRHNFNVEIINFGYGRGEDVGMPNAAAVFNPKQIETAQRLIVQLVQAGVSFDRPPNVLSQSPTSRFMGDVLFRDGWALVQSGERVS